ncbi:unnamed protein product [Amaranthus hypochondriacus]
MVSCDTLFILTNLFKVTRAKEHNVSAIVVPTLINNCAPASLLDQMKSLACSDVLALTSCISTLSHNQHDHYSQHMTNNSKGCSSSFVLLDKLQSLILAMSGFWSSVVCRSGNTIAHLVARWNSNSLGETILMYPFPHHLVSLATIDII